MSSNRIRLGALACAPALLALLANACAAPSGSEASEPAASAADAGAPAMATAEAAPHQAGQRILVTQKDAHDKAQIVRPMGGSNVNYNGGSVISNVHVVPVFWGQGVSSTIMSEVGCFFDAVVRGPYIDWLSEYNTPSQQIGEGTTAPSLQITPEHRSQALSDGDVQSELAYQIDGHTLPAPDANTIYMIYFPPGIGLSDNDGQHSCTDFCAYHESFSHNGQPVRYGVMPDLTTGPCQSSCGGGGFDATGAVSSHELAEAVTDADPNNAWSGSAGEIGDPCAWQEVQLTGTYYTVQKLWSNAHGGCYAPTTGFPNLDAPVITSATPAQGQYSSSTQVTINGSCFASPSGDVTEGFTSANFTVLPGSTFNQLIVSVPPSPTTEVGLAQLYVFNPGAGPAETPFTYVSSTTNTLSPGDGPMQGGTAVTIQGGPFPTALETNIGVMFDGVPAESVQCTSSTTCVAYPQAHDPGPVTVTLNVGGVIETVANQFTFDGPQITSVTPGSVPITGGTSLIVEGTNIADASEISFIAPMNLGSAGQFQALCVREGMYQASCEIQSPTLAALPASPQDVQVQITHTTGTKIWTPITPADRLTFTQLPALSGLSLGSGGGSVTLNGDAPSGGAVVALSLAAGSPSGIIQLPASVTVAAGLQTVPVPVTLLNYGFTGTVSVVASYGGTLASAILTLTAAPPPPPVALVTDDDLPFTSGMTETARIALGTPAPAGGAVVTLTNSNPTKLSVPASVSIPAGATTATFTMTSTDSASAVASATLTASYGGASASSTVSVGVAHVHGGGGGNGCGGKICQ